MHFNALMHELGALGFYTFFESEPVPDDSAGSNDASPAPSLAMPDASRSATAAASAAT
jgi:hypothetical protein